MPKPVSTKLPTTFPAYKAIGKRYCPTTTVVRHNLCPYRAPIEEAVEKEVEEEVEDKVEKEVENKVIISSRLGPKCA